MSLNYLTFTKFNVKRLNFLPLIFSEITLFQNPNLFPFQWYYHCFLYKFDSLNP